RSRSPPSAEGAYIRRALPGATALTDCAPIDSRPLKSAILSPLQRSDRRRPVMRVRRSIISASVFALVFVPLIPMQAQGGGPSTPLRAGQRGGRADAPTVGPGNLVTGVWGADPVAVDSRGWGWMTKSYVSA